MTIQRFFRIWLICSCWLAACAPAQLPPTPTATFTATFTPTATATHTPTSLPTATHTPTPTKVPPTQTPIPKPTLDVFPIGRFQTKAPEGLLTFEFYADGTWKKFLEKSFLDSGTYTLNGFQITLDAVECKRILNGPATYKWSYDGETLAFKTVGSDPCAPREYFTARKFTLVP